MRFTVVLALVLIAGLGFVLLGGHDVSGMPTCGGRIGGPDPACQAAYDAFNARLRVYLLARVLVACIAVAIVAGVRIGQLGWREAARSDG